MKAKRVLLAVKAIATLFWDSYRMILVTYLEKEKTINGEY